MREVVVVAAVRTPIGSFGGVFKDVNAIQLGVAVVKEAIQRSGIDPQCIEEVIMGNVLGAGLGQNISRQIAIHSGIPETASAFTVNKVCGSGLKAIQLGMQSIALGDAEIVICGGTESMSQAPYIVNTQRFGARMGHQTSVDLMLRDGLEDAFEKYHMGITAENIAKQYTITREAQDAFALESQRRAQQAIEKGYFEEEIVPITLHTKKGDRVITKDEYPRFDSTLEALSRLKPAFLEGGTVTAGNASGINDGAAVVVLMSREKADALSIKPLATLVACATSGVSPEVMGLGPVEATSKALDKAGWTVNDLECVEANEAFASQSLVVAQELGLSSDIVNVNGGAIALGHPIGASGTRILVTLLHIMKRDGLEKGLATLCIGGGQGISMLVKRDKE